jgi:hypothetical protein
MARNHVNNKWTNLLWVDCIAGGIVGVVTLLINPWLSQWYELPRNLVVLMGAANLLYASYSFSLAIRSTRPRTLILLLIAANLVWAICCLWWAFRFYDTASFFGLAHLLLEALFVGGLALFEWRWRESLRHKF